MDVVRFKWYLECWVSRLVSKAMNRALLKTHEGISLAICRMWIHYQNGPWSHLVSLWNISRYCYWRSKSGLYQEHISLKLWDSAHFGAWEIMLLVGKMVSLLLTIVWCIFDIVCSHAFDENNWIPNQNKIQNCMLVSIYLIIW